MRSLLSPELMRVLDRLSLGAPQDASGAHKGEYRSQSRGTSLEFSDYREYEPGDDYRYIDWNIYSRLDRLFVKVFTEERNRRLLLLVDCSDSMRIGDPPKELYARQLAAALGYVALRRGDEVRQADVSTRLDWRTPWWRGRHRLPAFLRRLAQGETGGPTDLVSALHTLGAEPSSRGRIAVLISDLFDRNWDAALSTLSRWRGTSVLVHLLAPVDWLFHQRGELELRDTESGERLVVSVDDEAARLYAEAARDWMQEVRDRCHRLGITCYQLDTSYPLRQLHVTTFREGGLLH